MAAHANQPPSYTAFTAVTVLAAALMLLLPDAAMAANGDNLTATLCGVANAIQQHGPANALATLAVIALGIAAMLGKVSWGMAMMLCTGIGVVFGAAGLLTRVGLYNSCADYNILVT